MEFFNRFLRESSSIFFGNCPVFWMPSPVPSSVQSSENWSEKYDFAFKNFTSGIDWCSASIDTFNAVAVFRHKLTVSIELLSWECRIKPWYLQLIVGHVEMTKELKIQLSLLDFHTIWTYCESLTFKICRNIV